MRTFAALHAYLTLCVEAGTIPGVASVVDFVTKQLLNGDSYEHDTFTKGDVLNEQLLEQDLLSKIPSQLPANMIPEALKGIRDNWNKSLQRRKDIGQEQTTQNQQTKTRQNDIKRELAPVSSKAPHFIYVDGNPILVEGSLSPSELSAAIHIVAQSTSVTVLNKQYGVEPHWSSESEQPVGYDILRDDGTVWFHIPKGPLTNNQIESIIYSKKTGKPSGVTASQLMDVWAAVEPQSIEAKAWLQKQAMPILRPEVELERDALIPVYEQFLETKVRPVVEQVDPNAKKSSYVEETVPYKDGKILFRAQTLLKSEWELTLQVGEKMWGYGDPVSEEQAQDMRARVSLRTTVYAQAPGRELVKASGAYEVFIPGKGFVYVDARKVAHSAARAYERSLDSRRSREELTTKSPATPTPSASPKQAPASSTTPPAEVTDPADIALWQKAVDRAGAGAPYVKIKSIYNAYKKRGPQASLRTKAAENAQFLRDHGFEGEAEDEEESNKGIHVRPV